MEEPAEDVLPRLRESSFDLIFTSPPYYRTERYDRSDGQSWIRYTSYEQWRNKFLATVIGHGCRVLQTGGYFLLNVKDTLDWPIASDAKALFPRDFTLVSVLRYLLPTQPHDRSTSSQLYRWEPIFVFRK